MKIYSALLKIKKENNVCDLNKKEMKVLKILAKDIKDALNKIKEEEYEVVSIKEYISNIIIGD